MTQRHATNKMFWQHSNTRQFKYDRDDLCVNKSQFVPVIFEPPCISSVILGSQRTVWNSGSTAEREVYLHPPSASSCCVNMCVPLEVHAIWRNLNSAFYNFLRSVITTWRKREIFIWDWLYWLWNVVGLYLWWQDLGDEPVQLSLSDIFMEYKMARSYFA